MKNTNGIPLKHGQNPSLYTFNTRQLVIVTVLSITATVLCLYGNPLVGLLLGALTLAVVSTQVNQQNLCKKHSISSITRLMSDKQLPKDLKVEVTCANKQKYLLITAPTYLKTSYVIVDIINPKHLDVRRLQEKIKYMQLRKVKVFVVLDRSHKETGYLSEQLVPLVGVYQVFGNLDHCLEHIRGQLVQIQAVTIK